MADTAKLSLATFAEVAGRSGHLAYGVRVFGIGEDGDWIVAAGHVEPRRMMAAANHYARHVEGLSNIFDSHGEPLPDVKHIEGRLGWPKPGHHSDTDWWLDWSFDPDDNESLAWGPFEPITVLVRL